MEDWQCETGSGRAGSPSRPQTILSSSSSAPRAPAPSGSQSEKSPLHVMRLRGTAAPRSATTNEALDYDPGTSDPQLSHRSSFHKSQIRRSLQTLAGNDTLKKPIEIPANGPKKFVFGSIQNLGEAARDRLDISRMIRALRSRRFRQWKLITSRGQRHVRSIGFDQKSIIRDFAERLRLFFFSSAQKVARKREIRAERQEFLNHAGRAAIGVEEKAAIRNRNRG